MKKLSESQIRQVVREELTKLLAEEAEVSKPEVVGKTTFGKLKQVQADLGNDPSPVRGPNFSTDGSFANLNDIRNVNDSRIQNLPIDIRFNKATKIYDVFFDVDGGGPMDFTISKALAEKLLSKDSRQEKTDEPKPSIYQKFKTKFGIKE